MRYSFLLLGLVLGLAGCPEKKTTGAADAAPAVAAEVDANLPWATEINMDASTAAAPAPAPAPGPAPAPSAKPTAAPAAFEGPLGTFTGNVKDSGQVYTLTVNLTATGGTASYSAPLNCKARWTYQGSSPADSPTSFRYVEKITEQPKPPTCADNVPVILKKESASTYYYSAGGGQAQSLLKKL